MSDITTASVVVDGARLVSDVETLTLEVGPEPLRLTVTVGNDGEGPYVQLTPTGCNLEGEMPGLYYLTPVRTWEQLAQRLTDDHRPDGATVSVESTGGGCLALSGALPELDDPDAYFLLTTTDGTVSETRADDDSDTGTGDPGILLGIYREDNGVADLMFTLPDVNPATVPDETVAQWVEDVLMRYALIHLHGCTGTFETDGRLSHDGPTCPVHEAD